jgi:hypothetical protein
MIGKWKVLESCINQDTKKRLRVGEIIKELSEFEVGRLTAFKYIVNIDGIETTIDKNPYENRVLKYQRNK